MSLSYWDGAYRSERKIWGAQPGEAARAAAKYVDETKFPVAGKRLLDLGCGYGRDLFFLASRWNVRAAGVDASAQAVKLARAELDKNKQQEMEFRCARFQEISDGPYDLVYAANLYQILPEEERAQLCQTVESLLAPGGLFIFSTLSSRDPEHAGKGSAVPGDPNSWVDQTFVHLSNRKELERNFHYLKFQRFYEHEFIEPRAGGSTHHHVSWILIGLHERSAGSKRPAGRMPDRDG
jgi:cyclopropane fatty-acyl-phospholipid synthase-like methyltransferase